MLKDTKRDAIAFVRGFSSKSHGCHSRTRPTYLNGAIILGVAIALTSASPSALGADRAGRWNAAVIAGPSEFTSVVALGATNDGIIIARARVADVEHGFLFLPNPRFGLLAGWTDLGAASARFLPSTSISHSLHGCASFAIDGTELNFMIATAQGFEDCGIGCTGTIAGFVDGWATSVRQWGDRAVLVGAAIRTDTSEGASPAPLRASTIGGIEWLTLPENCVGGAAFDSNAAGWYVGTGALASPQDSTESNWTALIGNTSAMQPMDDWVRGLGTATLDSCVAITDDFCMIANVRESDGSMRIVRLVDTRADHIIDGVVNVVDLGEYVADFAAVDSKADMDVSGSIESADLEVFIDRWATAQSISTTVPLPATAFRVAELAMRVVEVDLLPETLLVAARAELQSEILAQVGIDPPRPFVGPPDPCARVPFDDDSTVHWCGTDDFSFPDLFPACCAEHDNCYRGFPAGYSGAAPIRHPQGRRGCDDDFLKCMVKACNDDLDCPFARLGCYIAAGIYRLGVGLGGREAYCVCMRRHGLDPVECPIPAGGQPVSRFGSHVLP